MRDGAAVNGAAMRIFKAVYPKVFDVTCFCHAIDLVGNRFELPTLDCFMLYWTRLFAHSCAANLKWKERTATCIQSFSATRWWSRWEVMHQAMTHFGYVEPFLEENQDVAPTTIKRLRDIFQDEDERKNLIIELAAVIDGVKAFVQATYKLGSNARPIFTAY